jgi:DNA-binding protein YbaB
MMQQAQAMQGKVQAELEALRVEGTSGGGLVRIDPSAVDPSDVEMLQDLVLAALRDASRQVDDAVQKKTSSLLGGMLPGMR